MISKTKMLGLMLATAVVFNAPMLVYADNAGGDKDSWHQEGGWHHGQGEAMFAKVLNLNDDQVKQLKDNWKQQKETMKSVFEQMKSSREAFDAEIVKATPDMNKINAIQTQIKTIQSQLVDDRFNSILAIKKILTPEQFAGYMALKKEKQLKKHMMGHGKFGDKSDKDHDSDSQD